MTNEDVIKVKYKDAEIIYNDTDNKWHINIGKSTATSKLSLKEAKEYVDRFEKQKFERISAFKLNGGGWGFNRTRESFDPVTITSIAEEMSYNQIEAWISFGKNNREKISLNYLFADTPENKTLFEEYLNVEDDIDKLKLKAQSIKDKMIKVEIQK